MSDIRQPEHGAPMHSEPERGAHEAKDTAVDETRDETLSQRSGSWNRRIARFALPVIVSNISVPLLGAVDTAVVGRLPGAHYLGAVAVGALLFGVLYSGLFFLRMGTTGLTAQSLGARRHDEVRAWLIRAVLLAAGLGLTLVLLQLPLAWACMTLVGSSAEVEELARTYFHIRIWGAPCALANIALLGWFFGVQQTRAALFMMVAMNSANIALDLFFVLGLEWGVAGVAWATLVSEVGAFVLGAALARQASRALPGERDALDLDDPIHATPRAPGPRAILWDRAALGRMFAVNRDIFLRSMCLQAAFFAFTSVGARIGDQVLASNAILFQFQLFMAYGLDGLANAAESFVGEAFGARSRADVRAAVVATTRWAVLLALVFSAVYALLGPTIIDLLTHVDEVRSGARRYLPWAALMPMIAVWCFMFDGVFVGATRTAEMRNSMALSLVIFFAAAAALVPAFGNHGLWTSFALFMAARGVTLGRYYPRLERSVPDQP